MTIIWSPEAKQNRLDIWTYVLLENPAAAARLDQLFSKATKTLKALPARGRPGLIPGTREIFPHPHYRMVYEVEGNDVHIVALMHTSRSWPPVEEQAT